MTTGEQGPGDPTRKLVELWTEAARGYTDAMQSMWEQASKQAAGAAEGADGADGAAADPMAASQRMMAQWSDGVQALSAMQAQFLQRITDGLAAAGEQRLDAQTLGQLQRLASARWDEELRRLEQLPADLAGAAGRAEPARVGGLWQSMIAEYLRDLDALPADAFKLDLAPLAAAWSRVAAGTATDSDRARIERLLDAAAVKARHGSEYYADPEQTEVGQTPRACVFEHGALRLYRYSAPDGLEVSEAPAGAAPVLIVYSVINRPYILDLKPGFSFVEHLLAQGLDVYLIDWGETEPGDRETTLDSYIEPGIAGCVDAICERTGAEQVSLFGHCIGGNLALMYAALHPQRVARLVTLTTPITAAEGGVVALWTDPAVFPVDAIVDAYGHMPAKLIRYTFMAIKPYYEVMKWKMFLENLGNDAVMELFLPVDRWANENVDIPGEAFRKFVREVFHDERFRRGETRINGRKVDLSAITCPLLNLAATKDWIVPPASAEILGELVGADDRRYVPIEGAHVSVMIDPRARPVWTQMSDFLRETPPREATPDSADGE